jgi:ubiquinone/menaquinone biosynthesis C-methylase UbiE
MAYYIHALRLKGLNWLYDPVVRLTSRDSFVKRALIEQADVKDHARVLDVGCGTGRLLQMLRERVPDSDFYGCDGDEEILRSAVLKRRHRARLVCALSTRLPYTDSVFDQAVSSLLFHHLLYADKVTTLLEIARVLKPGGELHIADWGEPRSLLMRTAFLTVQLVDGFSTTRDSLKGLLPLAMSNAGFSRVEETRRMRTPCGVMSLYRGIAPQHDQSTMVPRLEGVPQLGPTEITLH